MQRFLVLVDSISTWVGKIFSWCIVLLTGVVSYEVFVRYVLGQPTTWAYDMSYILYGTLFMMTGAYALSRNAHVRGDVVYRFFPVKTQASIDLVLYIIFFFPGVIALVYSGYAFAAFAWLIKERSSFSPSGPPLYHFKSVIPIAAFFLLLQGIAETIRCAIALRTGVWPQRLHDVEELEKELLTQHQQPDGVTR
jgi:TRAP-type mannitol/chloroaromatic compound transport system permease small subunit